MVAFELDRRIVLVFNLYLVQHQYLVQCDINRIFFTYLRLCCALVGSLALVHNWHPVRWHLICLP